jgi:hypothetical protein
MVLPALKRNLSHKPGLFSRATSNSAVGKVILLMGEVVFPAEKSFCKRERSFLRRRNHFAHGSSHFSDGKVVLQMGGAISPAEKSFCKWEKSFFRRGSRFANGSSRFSGGKVVLQICKPPHKLAKPFFRRRNRFANGRNRFSGGKVTRQICRMAGLASKTQQNGIFTARTGLKWMSSSLPASREDSPGHVGRFRNKDQRWF